ncbi:MAG: Ig-like domain-containing protein, partial [Planctomycetaceae bacterium]
MASMDMYGVSKDSLTVAASGVVANDSDMESDPLTAVLYSSPSHGTISLSSNGGFTYTPVLGYAGSDSFQYRAFDGTSYSSATSVMFTVTNSWSTQTNAEDRASETADNFGAVGTVGFTGDTQAFASVGDGQLLVYSSNSEPKPIIAVETDFNGGTPTSLESVLTFNGVAGSTVYYNTTGISGTTRLRFATQVDASSLATGKYAWSMSLKAKYSDGSTSTRSYSGSSFIGNWNNNTEGDSWNIADMERLVSVSGGMLWTRGDGVTAYFAGSGTYTSPAGPYAFSTLVQNTGPTYTLTDQYGNKANFSATGNLTSRVDTNSNTTTYTYIDADSDSQTDDLSTVTDPWGRVTTLAYSGGLLVSVTDHAARVTTIAHDGQGRITSVTSPDPDGAGPLTSPVTTYGYSGTTRKLTTIADPLSHVATIAYDYVGLFDQITAADGGVQKLDPYQSRGIPASGTGTVGTPATPYLPNSGSNLYAVYTDQLNQVSKTVYNQLGQVTTFIDPLSSTTVSTRNSNGLVTQMTLPDPDGGGTKVSPVWNYQYDTKGNLTQLAFGSDIQTWVYNTLSRPTSHTDELSRSESWTWDTYGNQLTHTDKLGKVTTNANNSRGQVTSITQPDPDGAGALTSPVTTLAYDTLGRVVTLTNPDSSTQTFTYSTADQMLTSTDELGRVTTNTYDNLDRLKTVTQPDPDGAGSLTSPVTTAVYNAGSLVTSVTDAKGYVTSYTYDSMNRLTQTTLPDPDGAGSLTSPVWQTAWNVAGLMTSITDPVGAVTAYGYDNAQRNTTVTGADPDGAGPLTSPVTTYAYDPLGRTISVTDALSRVTTLEYDIRSRLTKQTQPAGFMSFGPVTQWAYNAASEMTSVTNPMGYVTSYAYDAMSRVTQVTQPDPDGAGALTSPVSGMTYDALGRNITQTDPLGNVTSLEYDNRSRLKKQTDPDPDGAGALTSPVTQWAYDTASQMTSMTNALGYVTTRVYDKLGRVKQVNQPDPDGAGALTSPILKSTYDSNNNVLTVTDPLNKVTTYAYDNLNRLKTLTQADPDGAGSLTSPVTTWNYDAANQVTSVVDPLNRTTSDVFDKLGRKTQTTLPDPDGAGSLTSPVINVAYNAVNRVTSVTDPLGNVTAYAYDNLDRVSTITQADPDGAGSLLAATQTNQYDLLGRLTSHKQSMTTADDQTSVYSYDNLNRLIQLTQPDPDGAGSQTAPVTSYTYNANGNRITETNPLGKVTTWAFDNLNRLTQTTQPDPDGAGSLTSPITTFGYDTLSRRTTLTDPDNNVTTWAFDGLNRMTSETNALGKADSYVYNAASDMTSHTDRNGRVTNYVYDNLHRRTQEKWMSGSTVLNTFAYTFDSASQLTGASATGTQMTYTFDDLGRVLTASNSGTTNIPTTIQTNVYDANSRRTQQTATVASVADYKNTWTWDNANRQTQVKQEGQTGGITVAGKRVDFTYNTGGMFTGLKRYNDLAGTQIVANTTYTYDMLARLTALDHKNASGGNLANYTWTFDSDRRITNFTNTDGYSNFTYDTNDQVTVVDHSYQTDETYTYDANGNRTNTGYTTGTNNRVTSDGTYNYAYDDEGNRISRTKISDSTKIEYTWDYRNRLTAVVNKNA